ncbi:MAG: transglycosylase domain-containing protein [Kofleriaceae bacterium]|nr:transglycosylase domain-containing protein [Kofleriaceae bacterium]MBP9165771.1 transglycosylase domain-containing protein [Kofleriaceae bacterium]MBP9857920.1 transglycosylase domain-containing protein [Kofleriaceae bacterium]
MPSWWRRRALRRAAIAAAVVAILAVAAVVAYPRVGAWYVRSRAVPRLAERYGAAVTVGAVDVGWGHATLRDVTVAPRGAAPAIHLGRVEVDFDGLATLVGRAEVSRVAIVGGAIEVVRGADGATNLDGFRRPTSGGVGGRRGSTPIDFSGLAVRFRDDGTGATGSATLAGRRRGDRLEATLTELAMTSADGPALAATAVVVEREAGRLAATVDGGQLQIWTGLALTGIAGTIAQAATPGQLAVDLTGGYGGVAGTLWTARGWVEPATAAGEVRIKADAFSLEKLAPLLEGRRVLVNYPRTVVDADLVLARRGDVATMRGGFHVADLTVAHPMIADQPVAIESLSGEVDAAYDRATRTLTLRQGDLGTRGLPFGLTGEAVLGPRLRPTKLAGRLVVPAVPCQQVLTALPAQLTGEMTGFELTGMFSTDLRVAIDWADLDATTLGGSVGIRGCKARRVAKAVERLDDSFEHWVEVGTDEWLSFEVGAGNPDFVPITEVSPYLLASLQTTEDGAFYRHRGFIPSEFRTALIRNLKAGGFRYGASSITMQMVKNVLLYRKKTLARKFQELFLTWAVENYLTKDRIFEIYVNAIEYGPALYGIGPAARAYFGKSASDLTLREAAFFSSILPNPKERYRQYCKGELRRWTEDKIGRILDKMLERQRITAAEHAEAKASPLVFAKDGTETEAQCLRRVEQALKKARPTNPMAPPR